MEELLEMITWSQLGIHEKPVRWFFNIFLYLSSLSKEEYAEAMRILETLNKPAVTSFQREDGHIVNCIDFYKQPALDNPLLKNHTIQVLPFGATIQWPFGNGQLCPAR